MHMHIRTRRRGDRSSFILVDIECDNACEIRDLRIFQTSGRKLCHDHSSFVLPRVSRKPAGKLETSALVQKVAKLEKLF